MTLTVWMILRCRHFCVASNPMRSPPRRHWRSNSNFTTPLGHRHRRWLRRHVGRSLTKNAGMRGTLFELARVARAARPLLADVKEAKRIEIEIGDIVAAPPVSLHDVAILRAVIQVLSSQDAARAIAHVFTCLRP